VQGKNNTQFKTFRNNYQQSAQQGHEENENICAWHETSLEDCLGDLVDTKQITAQSCVGVMFAMQYFTHQF
jgi:hypothetical protein